MACKDEVTALRKFGDFAEFYESQDTEAMIRMLAYVQAKYPYVCIAVGDMDNKPENNLATSVVLYCQEAKNFGRYNKISIIKAVRCVTGCSLKEGKDLVEASEVTPMTFKVYPSKQEAIDAAKCINIEAKFNVAKTK